MNLFYRQSPSCTRFGAVSVMCLLVCLGARAGAVSPYVTALESKRLVEGLGFEGALTVFDEVKRMHRRLGTPSHRSDLYYRYDGGGFQLEVYGAYRQARFEVIRIRYSDDKERRVRTDTGFRLGDPISRVLEQHGVPDVQEKNKYTWNKFGVTYAVSDASTVTAITVFRPQGVQGAKANNPKIARKEKLSQVSNRENVAEPSKAIMLADLGVSAPLGGWRLLAPLTEAGGTFETQDGFARFVLSVCRNCSKAIIDSVKNLELKLGKNRLPVANRKLSGAGASGFGAERGYLGVYSKNSDRTQTWLWALLTKDRGYLLTLKVQTNQLLATGLMPVLRVIQELKVVP